MAKADGFLATSSHPLARVHDRLLRYDVDGAAYELMNAENLVDAPRNARELLLRTPDTLRPAEREFERHPWYAELASELPQAQARDEIESASARLREACERGHDVLTAHARFGHGWIDRAAGFHTNRSQQCVPVNAIFSSLQNLYNEK